MYYSPLRYPGGKGKLAPLIGSLIYQYGHVGGTYIEPFAGGAAVALELLEKHVVSEIVINDLDKGIYSFWRAILEDTERFISKIYDTPISIEEWNSQKRILYSHNNKYSFELGFATFYLNRANRSGIIKGGVIGGINQSGEWKMDARFNKDSLIKRIESIAKKKTKIHVYNKDIKSFIERYVPKYEDNAFIYFDPPYFKKGKQLYLNYFEFNDHLRIERLIKEHVKCDWIITYDDETEIERIYKDYCIYRFELNYSVSKKRRANELLISPKSIADPYNLLKKVGPIENDDSCNTIVV